MRTEEGEPRLLLCVSKFPTEERVFSPMFLQYTYFTMEVGTIREREQNGRIDHSSTVERRKSESSRGRTYWTDHCRRSVYKQRDECRSFIHHLYSTVMELLRLLVVFFGVSILFVSVHGRSRPIPPIERHENSEGQYSLDLSGRRGLSLLFRGGKAS